MATPLALPHGSASPHVAISSTFSTTYMAVGWSAINSVEDAFVRPDGQERWEHAPHDARNDRRRGPLHVERDWHAILAKRRAKLADCGHSFSFPPS
jgi:hypothetical protein